MQEKKAPNTPFKIFVWFKNSKHVFISDPKIPFYGQFYMAKCFTYITCVFPSYVHSQKIGVDYLRVNTKQTHCDCGLVSVTMEVRLFHFLA